MGAFLEKPKTDKQCEGGSGNGLHFGLSSMQGWRVEMEDAHTAVTGLPGILSKWSFFAVFDGHAGARVSEFCAQQLLNVIVETNDFKSIQPECVPPLEAVQKGIRDGFLNLDQKMRQMPEMESGEDKSGSTAVSVLISPDHFFFANCGDSRAILVRGGKVHFATQDHKPINPGEKERIQNAGGSVMIQRVNGSLAVSRSLGDFDYKNVEGKGPTEQLVSPEPEISVVDRLDSEDQFMVLACDGVWDVMSNDELAEFVLHRLHITDDYKKICNEVIDTCLYKGSRDNMSIVIVCFGGAPLVDAQCLEKEKALDEQLRKMIEELIRDNNDADLNFVYNALNASSDLHDLPPGGGLAAKRLRVEEFLKEIQTELGIPTTSTENDGNLDDSD